MRFLIGGLALSGIFPFAGFFSKDSILLGAFTWHQNGKIVWIIGLVTAFMTAYYTFRVIYRTFYGPVQDKKLFKHAHESPDSMILPLTILAVLSIAGGWIGIPGYDRFTHFLEPMFPKSHHEVSFGLELGLMGASLLAGLSGIYLAYQLHVKKPEIAEELATVKPLTARLHQILLHKYYVDEIYDFLFVHPIRALAERILVRAIDVNTIDGIVNDTGSGLRGIGGLFRKLHTGDARTYAAAILIGTLGLIAYFVWTVKG